MKCGQSTRGDEWLLGLGLTLAAVCLAGGCGSSSVPRREPEPSAGKTELPSSAELSNSRSAATNEVRQWLDRVREAGPDEDVDRFREVRPTAADAIDAAGSAAVAVLADALRNDPAWHVREFAAFALGRQGTAAIPAVPALLSGLKDANFLVIEACDGSLGSLADSGAASLAAVAVGLDDRDAAIRGAVAELLGAVGPSAVAVLPRLTALANDDPDASVRSAAAAAAAAIGGTR